MERPLPDQIEVVDKVVETQTIPLELFGMLEAIMAAASYQEMWDAADRALRPLLPSGGYTTFSLKDGDRFAVEASYRDGHAIYENPKVVLPKEAITHVIAKTGKPVIRKLEGGTALDGDWFRGTRCTMGVPIWDQHGTAVGSMTVSSYDGIIGGENPVQTLQLVSGAVSTCMERTASLERTVEAGKILERERVLQELHDTAIQSIFSCELGLLDVLKHELPIGISRKLGLCLDDIRDANRSMRQIMSHANDGNESMSRLSDLVDAEVAEHKKRSMVKTSASVGPCPPLPAMTARVASLFLRESLCNVRKHAQASNIAVSATLERDILFLSVEDDGVGLPANNARPADDSLHFGISNIRRAIQLLGGTYTIELEPEEGTSVRARIPLTSYTADSV